MCSCPSWTASRRRRLIRQRRQSEMTPIIFITAFGSDEIADTDRYRRGRGRLHLRPGATRRAAGQGLGLRQPVHQGRRYWPPRPGPCRSSADQLRLLTDAAPIGIFQTDADDATSTRTRAGPRSPGFLRQRRSVSRSDSVIASELRPDLMPTGSTIRTTVGPSCPAGSRSRVRIRPRRVAWCTVAPIPDDTGAWPGWVGTWPT